jgi:MFS family permease
MGAAAQAGRDRRPLYGVLAAFAAGLTGTRVATIALPWLVLVSTGSAAKTGLLALCQLAPYVVVKALAGPWVDSVGPRRVSISMDLVAASAIGLVPVLAAVDALALPVLLGLAAVSGAASGPGDSAKEVFLPQVAEQARMALERVTGLSGSIERLASTVGPAVAGALVAVVGPAPALVVTAVATLLSAALIAWCTDRPEPRPAHDGEQGRPSYRRRLLEGWRHLRSDGLLRSIVAMIAVTNLLDAALSQVLLPVWAKETGAGPAAIGLLGSVLGAAALAGSLAATVVAHRMPRRAVFLVGFLLGGAPRFVVLGVDADVPLTAAVWAVAGLGVGFINPIVSAVFFERVPRPLLGRVNALGDATAWSLMPFGGLAAAGLLGLVGLGPALLAAGAAYLVTTTVPALRPEWGRMRARPPPADEEPVRAPSG